MRRRPAPGRTASAAATRTQRAAAEPQPAAATLCAAAEPQRATATLCAAGPRRFAALCVACLVAGLAAPRADAAAAPRVAVQSGDAATLALGGTLTKLKLSAAAGAKIAGKRATLAVRGVSVRGRVATVTLRGTLVLRSGKRSLKLTAPRLQVGAASRLTVVAGKQRLTLATLFAPAKIRAVSAERVRLDRAPATLTAVAAKRIQRALALKRRPSGRLGTVSLRVGADPAPAPVAEAPPPAPQAAFTPTATPDPVPIDDGGPDPIDVTVCPSATNGYAVGEHVEALPAAPGTATAVTGGTVAWGFSASLRGSFPAFAPGDAETYVPRTLDGGPCGEPYRTFAGSGAQLGDDTFRFGVGDGWYDADSGRAALNLDGAFRIGYFIGGWSLYPAPIANCEARGQYCGLWAVLTDAQIAIDGTTGTISAYSEAGGNVPWRYVPWLRRTFATLDLGGITPDTSVPGQVTWRDVGVTLTAEGGPLGLEYYSAGDALDPITITLQT